MMFDVGSVEEAKKEMLLSGFKKLSIPSLSILDYGRRGKYTSRAASLIRFINVRCRMQVHAPSCYGQRLS
jgi:hypothetical protein